MGAGRFAPFLEHAVLGMEPGATKTTTFSAKEAFGERRAEFVYRVHPSSLPERVPALVGEVLEIHDPRLGAMSARITDITESTVTLDANHPLAGKDVTLDITVLSIG